VRAPTPTAAAELVAPERQGLVREVASRLGALARASARALGERFQRLDYALRVLGSPRAPLRGLEARLAELRARCARQALAQWQRADRQLANLGRSMLRLRPEPALARRRLRELVERLQRSQGRALQQRASTLAHLERALAHLNVQGVLDRGFAIVRDEQGRIVTDAGTLELGAPVQASFARGGAQLLVQSRKDR
jgi:exodeoxyribonuclease VII large subunit